MNYKNLLFIISTLTFFPSHKSFPSAAAAAGAGISCLIAPPGGLAVANPEDSKEKKEKIDKTKAELNKFRADFYWKKRKEIITKAVLEDNIHPDSLTNFDDTTPLHDSLFERDEDDLAFARFLLDNNANPNRIKTGDPILEGAKTVAMVQLLFDRGANQTVAAHGPQLLQNAARLDQCEPELVEWYVQYGVDPNGYYKGQTPLIKMIFHHDGYRESGSKILKKVHLLMQSGALMALEIDEPNHRCDGQNVAQIIKSELEEYQKKLQNNPKFPQIERFRIGSLENIRNTLIAVSNYRHYGLKADLSKYTILLPVLCDLVVGYYIALEPRYEALEAMPVLSKEYRQVQRGEACCEDLLEQQLT